MTRMRVIRAAVVAIAGVGLFLADRSGRFEEIEGGYREWLGAGDAKWTPARVTVIDAQRPGAEERIAGIDVALFLRAVLRLQPSYVIMASPIEPGDDAALVAGVLDRAGWPAERVVFCSGPEAARLGGIRLKDGFAVEVAAAGYLPENFPSGAASAAVASGAGWKMRTVVAEGGTAVATVALTALLQREEVTAGSVDGAVPGLMTVGARRVVPVELDGMTFVRRVPERNVATATLDDLLLMTERSEKGMLSALLPSLMSNRVVVLMAGGNAGEFGQAMAGLLSGLLFRHTPMAVGVAVVLGGVLLAWYWRGSAMNAALMAVCLLSVWLLQALAWVVEFQTILPLALPAGVLAVFVAVCTMLRIKNDTR
jgi:hypothetical protein